jgi:L-asparaginase
VTGTQRPLADPNSDAPRNLQNAVYFASDERVREICVFFDSVLLRGNRTKKLSIPSFGAFSSPNFPALATVGTKTEWNLPSQRNSNTDFLFDVRIETRVLSVPLFPGINPEFLFSLADQGLKGLVLQAFGPGDIPLAEDSIVQLIRILTEKGVPTVICSQAPLGTVDLNLYETGRAARDAGAISAHDMTWEACLVKMMILLGRGVPLGPFRKLFLEPISGEISIS